MESKNNSRLIQVDAFSGVPAAAPEFSIAEVRRCEDFTAALRLSQKVARLIDKQISHPLKIKESQYSRIMSGINWIPNNHKFLGFLNLTDNDIPIIWAAERRGWDWSTIRKHTSNLEKENERLRAELAESERVIARIVRASR